MKNKFLLFLVFSLPAFAFGQVLKTAAIPYTGSTAFTPNIATSSELRIDTSSSVLYWWYRDGLTWMRYPHGVDIITGGSAPAYTPRDNQGRFAINADNELYYHTGSAWVQIGGSGGGGIYGGSGSVPDGAVATLVDDFEFTGPDISSYTVTTGTSTGGQYFQNFTGATTACRDTTGDNYMSVTKNGIEMQFDGSFDRLTINDRDARYGADYSATYSARSLIDKGYADGAYLSDANWTTGFSSATQATSSWTATNAGSNVNAAIVPKGTGGLLADVPDGTSAGGNSRGTRSVDLQIDRISASQVASGTSSGLFAGRRNLASGTYSTVLGGSGNTANAEGACSVGGQLNTVSGQYAANVCGSGNTASGTAAVTLSGVDNTASADYSATVGGNSASAYLYSQAARASGKFTSVGDAQFSELVLRRNITGTSQTEMFIDGAGVRAILPATNRIWNFKIDVVGVCNTVGNGVGITAGEVWASWHCGAIKRIGSTTSLVGTVQAPATAQSDAGMATAVITIDADDSTEALRIRITPPATAGTTTVCRWVATFRLTEIGY